MATTADLGTVGGIVSLPYPMTLWKDTSRRQTPLSNLFWANTAGTWTLSSLAADEDGELVDIGATGVFTLVTVGTSPTAPRLEGVQRGTTAIFR